MLPPAHTRKPGGGLGRLHFLNDRLARSLLTAGMGSRHSQHSPPTIVGWVRGPHGVTRIEAGGARLFEGDRVLEPPDASSYTWAEGVIVGVTPAGSLFVEAAPYATLEGAPLNGRRFVESATVARAGGAEYLLWKGFDTQSPPG